MRRLSNTAIKRIIAGSLALALTFTSVGLNNFTWADEDEVEEVKEVDVDENANTDETIDQGSESELPTDEVVTSDEETEEVASNDENSEEATDTENSKEATDAEASEEDANSKDATSESDDAEKCEHEDADEDGTCDKCGKSMSDEEAEVCEHVDEDEDGVCDKCGEEMPKEDTEEPETEKVFELNATEIKLGIDDTFTVTATLDGEDVTESIELSTDDKAVSVEDYTISANKEGEAVVTAKYVDDEDTYTSSINVVVVDEIIIDNYNGMLLGFNTIAPIFVKSSDDIADALPKATKAMISVSENDCEKYGYDANDLTSNGFVYYDVIKAYIKQDANVEMEWHQTSTDEIGGTVYSGTIVSDGLVKGKAVKSPKLNVYVNDGEYSGHICHNCFAPVDANGNCIACGDTENNCSCEEMELSFDYPERIAAWKEKYNVDNSYDLVLAYDNDYFDSFKTGTKEIASLYRENMKHGDAFVNYLSELPLKDVIKLIDENKIDLTCTSLSGIEIKNDQLKKLADYNFTIADIAKYIDAYNGYDNSSTLYRLYMMGERSEALDYLHTVINDMYYTTDVAYINGHRTQYKNTGISAELREVIEDLVESTPNPSEEVDVEDEEDTTASISEEKTSILKTISNKFAFINVSAAEAKDKEEKEPPVREGDGWYDHLASGTGDTLEFKEPGNIIHIKKNGSIPIATHHTYVKTVAENGQHIFCVQPNNSLSVTTYMWHSFVQNGWAVMFADDRFTYEQRQALMWYVMAPNEKFKEDVFKTYYNKDPLLTYAINGGADWLYASYDADLINRNTTGFNIYIASIKGSTQQILYLPTYEPDNTPPEVMISTTTEYATGSDDTYYKTDLDKYSVITNEKLQGIKFGIQERVANNPYYSVDIAEGYRENTTNANGYITETFHHHASWSVPYQTIKDEGAILEYIGTGEASQQFVDRYYALKNAIDSGSDGFRNYQAAANEVERLRRAFKAVEYDYTWTEQNTYNRPASSQDQNNKTLNLISLPKQGYRMNITKIDNSNKYSAVSNSDLTSPSTKTTSAVHDGGNGHVDISNQPWRAQIFINKTDLETNNQIKYDTKFDIYEMENGKYPEEPSKNYRVVRINEEIANKMNWDKSTIGMYTIEYIGTTFGGTNPADDKQHTPLKYGTVYYTQSNTGKFKIVETKAPSYEEGKTGYIGNFAKRPYTRVENDLDSRFALSGRTNKTYPTPQQIVKVAAGNCRYCQFKKVLHHLYGQE